MTVSLLFSGVLLLLPHPDWDQIRAGCTESVITSDDPALATLCRGVAHLNKNGWNDAGREFGALLLSTNRPDDAWTEFALARSLDPGLTIEAGILQTVKLKQR